jgi:hypothetical protein
MDLEFLDMSAPELKSWLTNRGGYLFEERPQAVYRAAVSLRNLPRRRHDGEQACH